MQYLEADGTDDAYVRGGDVARLASLVDPGMCWSVGKAPSTIQVGKHYIKSIDRFDLAHYNDEAGFRGFLTECQELGVKRPSSYASVFHKRFFSPRIPRSLNRLLGAGTAIAGGWQEARELGTLDGRWYRYDMQSAYLWSSTLGLPVVQSCQYVETIETSRAGVYRLELARPAEGAPYPYGAMRNVVASLSEIDMYKLDIARVIGGVVWTDCHPEDHVSRAIPDVPWKKHVARAYWGQWASQEPVMCRSRSGKEWPLKNPWLNLLWAHLIVGRVKQHLYELADSHRARVAHVYVDSVVVDSELPTGDAPGQWRLELAYPSGLRIHGPGLLQAA